MTGRPNAGWSYSCRTIVLLSSFSSQRGVEGNAPVGVQPVRSAGVCWGCGPSSSSTSHSSVAASFMYFTTSSRYSNSKICPREGPLGIVYRQRKLHLSGTRANVGLGRGRAVPFPLLSYLLMVLLIFRRNECDDSNVNINIRQMVY